MTGLSADHHEATGASMTGVTGLARVMCGDGSLPTGADGRAPIPAAFGLSRPPARRPLRRS
ncbi:hypothetical protein [Sphingomonas melonis]|uniref:Uncharacterized protein n=1 Tax=Sphingomonas melonis TaxID=152682 RepID=A0A7Y9FKI7_9SPHN|nr:hypothetical protein [Sphingomonas melonis]NYD88949.1 hypothetical protein [Sphingomonas melonis]